MEFSKGKIGRIFVLRLHHKEHVPEAVETFAAKHKISNALCFLIGGVSENSRIVVGPETSEAMPVTPMTLQLGGVHEASAIGTIFADEEGKPKLHMHAALGRSDKGKVGCIRTGIEIWQTGEIVILELANVTACRTKDAETGFETLKTTMKNPRIIKGE